MKDELLLQDIYYNVDGVEIINKLNLKVKPGQIIGLIGPNGSGKTTVLNIITGFVKPTIGKVYYGKICLNNRMEKDIPMLGIGRLWQDIRLFKNLSIIDNIILSIINHPGEKLFVDIFSRRTVKKFNERIIKTNFDCLEKFETGIKNKSNVANLSFGEAKIFSLCNLFSSNYKMLLLDEPFAGLSENNIRVLLSKLNKLKSNGTSILIVDHNLSYIQTLCDFVYSIKNGRNFESGTPRNIFRCNNN